MTEQLFTEVYKKAYPVALKILANQQDAKDAAQECAFSFYKVLHDLDPSTNIAGYVYRIAVNAAYDRLREIKRRHEEPLPVPDVGGRELASNHPNYGDDIDKKRLIERLAGYVGKLPEKQRQAIQLKGLEGMSLQEMADTMESEVVTAKNWVYRGIAELRKHFGEREERYDPNVKKD